MTVTSIVRAGRGVWHRKTQYFGSAFGLSPVRIARDIGRSRAPFFGASHLTRMGLSWQQGPLAPGAVGRLLVPEPLRRRMRVRFGGTWIADSEHVLLLFEPGRYPVAYFPETDIAPNTLERTEYTTRHHDLGLTSW